MHLSISHSITAPGKGSIDADLSKLKDEEMVSIVLKNKVYLREASSRNKSNLVPCSYASCMLGFGLKDPRVDILGVFLGE